MLACVRLFLVAAWTATLSALPNAALLMANEATQPSVELNIDQRRFVIPRDYIRTFSNDPPSVELFIRWPTFDAFPEDEVARRPNPYDWSGLLIVLLDNSLSTLPVEETYSRLLPLLGSSVRTGERYGLVWEGPGPDSNPYDPHEIGTTWAADGTLASFVICGRSCQLQTSTTLADFWGR